jgi:hypothetical protein
VWTLAVLCWCRPVLGRRLSLAAATGLPPRRRTLFADRLPEAGFSLQRQFSARMRVTRTMPGDVGRHGAVLGRLGTGPRERPSLSSSCTAMAEAPRWRAQRFIQPKKPRLLRRRENTPTSHAPTESHAPTTAQRLSRQKRPVQLNHTPVFTGRQTNPETWMSHTRWEELTSGSLNKAFATVVNNPINPDRPVTVVNRC